MSRDPGQFQLDLRSEMADLWRHLQRLLVARPAAFCKSIWVPSHAMEEEADPEREEKRQDKLRRARAQGGWDEAFLHYNDMADGAARRARDHFPVPAWAKRRIQAVDSLARRALHAAVEVLDEAPPARRAPRGLRASHA